MTMKQLYPSETHQTMTTLDDITTVRTFTTREFDEASVQLVQELKPEEIRSLRDREKVSQSIFAAYLNVSRNLVADWERGKRKPIGPAMTLLNIIQKYGLAVVATPPENAEFLQSMLAQHRRNLQLLQRQKANFGAGEEPLRLLNQIVAEEEEIGKIERELGSE